MFWRKMVEIFLICYDFLKSYSLYVVNNHYLEELWFGKVAIMRGCVYFHLNPRLCFEEIMKLQDNFKECTDITVKDASRNSNGERVACK